MGNGIASTKPATLPSREGRQKRLGSPSAAVVFDIDRIVGSFPTQEPGLRSKPARAFVEVTPSHFLRLLA